jgi:hypothetical protein
MGGEAVKRSSVFEWYNRFKESSNIKTQMKTMFIILLDIKGIVQFEFISQDKTANQAYYMEILRRLCGAVR